MPSLTDSISSFISSIFTALTSVLTSILAIFQHFFNAIIGVITTAFAAVGTTLSGLAQTFEGLIKFLLSTSAPTFLAYARSTSIGRYSLEDEPDAKLVAYVGNILIIGVVVGGLFLYGVYNQRQGRSVTAAPKKTQ